MLRLAQSRDQGTTAPADAISDDEIVAHQVRYMSALEMATGGSAEAIAARDPLAQPNADMIHHQALAIAQARQHQMESAGLSDEEWPSLARASAGPSGTDRFDQYRHGSP